MEIDVSDWTLPELENTYKFYTGGQYIMPVKVIPNVKGRNEILLNEIRYRKLIYMMTYEEQD